MRNPGDEATTQEGAAKQPPRLLANIMQKQVPNTLSHQKWFVETTRFGECTAIGAVVLPHKPIRALEAVRLIGEVQYMM